MNGIQVVAGSNPVAADQNRMTCFVYLTADSPRLFLFEDHDYCSLLRGTGTGREEWLTSFNAPCVDQPDTARAWNSQVRQRQ